MDSIKEKEVNDYIWNLPNCTDDEIFRMPTLEDLGEYFYKKITTKFPTVKKEFIQRKVCLQSHNRLLTNSDLYNAICSHIFIKKLPKNFYDLIRNDIDKLASEYASLKSKIEREINILNLSLQTNRETARSLKHLETSRQFLNDISENEYQILNCEVKCNQDRTKKEILIFLKSYLEKSLLSFCDLQDIDARERKCKSLTMKYCTLYFDDDYSILYNDYFQLIKAFADDVNHIEKISFKVKYISINDKARIIYLKHAGLDINKVEEANSEAKKYLDSFPTIEELITLKATKQQKYCKKLKSIINIGNIEAELEQNIDSCICLTRRKKVLNKCIKLYREGEYELFSNIVPIQIEGIFNDFLRDVTTFNRFSEINLYSNKVLKEKVAIIWEKENNIPPESIVYFMHYFNNLIRNTTAHGNASYMGENETTAHELLLDLNSIVYLVTRYGEMERMHRFVQSHKKTERTTMRESENDIYFDALYASLTGEQTVIEYDYYTKYNPIQIAYWLVNPYYERSYASIGRSEDLKSIRQTFLDAEFWRYVYEQVKVYNPMHIKSEFLSVINGLFSCDITDETRRELIKVRKIVTENHLIDL